MTGNVTIFGVGFGWNTANASQFTKYQDFSRWYWGPNTDHYLNWPTYSTDDPFTNIEIMNAQVGMKLPNSAATTDAWYFGTYSGPTFENFDGSLWNTYMATCALSPSGTVDGVVMIPMVPSPDGGQGGGT
ncbi:hypothetical protein PWR63_01310 [Paraburkholderia sp. A2WS-5]|uniref:hypothetical protein n=1 Tax=unclassified Paraburkholderia TaxID=2615204 RepID=UPI003B802CA0